MRSIWAVARVTIREALRQKAAIVILVALVVLLPALGLSVKGDATLPGRAQMFLDWSQRVTRLLLALLTVFVACGTLAWELKYKQSYITLVKPIPRWQFLLGKWTGIGLLNLGLLAAVGLVMAGFAWNFRGRPALGFRWSEQKMQVEVPGPEGQAQTREIVLPAGPYWDLAGVEPPETLSEQQLQRHQREYDILTKEVLAARAWVRLVPPLNELSEQVDAQLAKHIETGQLPPGRSRSAYRNELFMRTLREYATVEPMARREFRFENLETARRTQGDIMIRYRIEAPSTPNDMLSYLWQVGEPGKSERVYRVPRVNEPLRIVHKLRVPADAIASDGTLLVTFVNVNPLNPEATFPVPATFWGDDAAFATSSDRFTMTGLEVLYPADDFETNLARSLAMVWVQLLFLAALGLFAASFLTFPTACLLCLLVFSAGSAVGYLTEAISWVHRDEAATITGPLTTITGPLVKVFLGAVPNFGEYTPGTAMVEGRLVSWGWLGEAILHVGVIRATVVLLLGAWVLTRREVAQVVV